MTNCLVCQDGRVEQLLDLGMQAVSSHYLPSRSAAEVGHRLALAVCDRCGLIQLAQPFPYKDLVPPYDWISYREPETHLDAVVDKILRLPELRPGMTAAGVTFKDHTTLERLHARGFSGQWTIDARQDLGATSANANIETVQALLTPAKAKEIAARRGQVDVLVARHIAEHAEAPTRFMEALSALIAPGGYLILEVPDCSANLAREDYAMIWEEHVLYFTRDTVEQILAPAGYVNLGIDEYPFPFENVFVLYAQKAKPNVARSLPSADAVAVKRNVERARVFTAAYPAWTKRYHRKFSEMTSNGKKLAGYGAGHLACAFINFHELSEYFSFVVDDTPHKQGLFLPKCRLPIVPRTRLNGDEIAACLFGLDPQLEDKIIANNPGYAQSGGQFFSMFVDSPRSVRRAL